MTTTKSKPNEISISRFYAAPASAVWDAWTDPDQVGQWWGPRGFTLTTHSKDIRTGGHWHYTMHGPDGVDYVNKTKYLEVVPGQKLVYDHGGNDERKPLFRVTVVFTEVPGGTRMDMTMACPTPEDAVQTRGFIKKAGGNATWDRLAEHLEKRASGREVFVINRSFAAPVAALKPEVLKEAGPNAVTFTEEDLGTTRVTVTADLSGPAADARPALAAKWTAFFDRLEA